MSPSEIGIAVSRAPGRDAARSPSVYDILQMPSRIFRSLTRHKDTSYGVRDVRKELLAAEKEHASDPIRLKQMRIRILLDAFYKIHPDFQPESDYIKVGSGQRLSVYPVRQGLERESPQQEMPEQKKSEQKSLKQEVRQLVILSSKRYVFDRDGRMVEFDGDANVQMEKILFEALNRRKESHPLYDEKSYKKFLLLTCFFLNPKAYFRTKEEFRAAAVRKAIEKERKEREAAKKANESPQAQPESPPEEPHSPSPELQKE